MAVIGFVGLGHMGGPMAVNLVSGGHTVRGFDLDPGVLETVRAAGVLPAESVTAAATDVDAVITMLPGGKQVQACYPEVLAAARPGTLLVDSSTVDVAEARQVHEQAREAGFGALDAPVSGGTAGAEAGTLTFMVGGDEAEFHRAEELLQPVARKLIHCGGAGNGQVVKMCNNLILGASMIAVSEAFVLGERLGLPPRALYDVASVSTGQCWALTTNCPEPGMVSTSRAEQDYEPGFASALMAKDLRLACSAAEQSGTDTELGRLALDLYEKFNETGRGDADFGAIIKWLRERSDQE